MDGICLRIYTDTTTSWHSPCQSHIWATIIIEGSNFNCWFSPVHLWLYMLKIRWNIVEFQLWVAQCQATQQVRMHGMTLHLHENSQVSCAFSCLRITIGVKARPFFWPITNNFFNNFTLHTDLCCCIIGFISLFNRCCQNTGNFSRLCFLYLEEAPLNYSDENKADKLAPK